MSKKRALAACAILVGLVVLACLVRMLLSARNAQNEAISLCRNMGNDWNLDDALRRVKEMEGVSIDRRNWRVVRGNPSEAASSDIIIASTRVIAWQRIVIRRSLMIDWVPADSVVMTPVESP